MTVRARDLAVPLAAIVLALAAMAPAAPPVVNAATTRNVPALYPNIQAAVDAAAPGDTVLVAPGTYLERIVVDKDITVASSAGAVTTIIDAEFGGTAVILNGGATFRGFTVQHGGGGNAWPGGINAGTDVLVEGNRIVDNIACAEGGGISAAFSNAIIQDNYIARNHQSGCSGGNGGGGVTIRGAGSVQLLRNVIEDNSFGSLAGGVSVFGGGAAVIDSNVIRGNSGSEGGGLGLTGGDNVVVTNNLIVGNTAVQGGGIASMVSSGSPGPTVVNNTIADNTAPTGAGFYTAGFDEGSQVRNNVITGSGSPETVHCASGYDADAYPQFGSNDVWNATGPEWAGVCPGLTGTGGNTSVDPRYVDRVHGDYHLRPDSPLIDAGPATWTQPKDGDGDSRPHDGDEDGTAEHEIGYDEATDPLLVDPGSLYFGNVDVGASAPETVTLTNLGASPLSITSVAIGGANAGDFTIAEPLDDTCTGATLAVSASCIVEVRFAPTASGTRFAELTLTGPGVVGTRTVVMEGEGLDPILVLGGPMTFATTPVGSTSAAKHAQVNNYGAPTSITSISIDGPQAADFAIVSDGCSGQALPTAQACPFDVTFSPKAIGTRTATVTITGPSPVGIRTIAVSGTGSPPASGVAWGTTYAASPSYSWNGGYGLARTVQGTTQRLHGLYATDRVGGTWAKDAGPYAGVYYTRASSGTTWSTGRRLNPTNQHAARLGIAAYGSRVYTTWVSQTRIINYASTAPRVVYVRVNTNHGESAYWKTAIRLTSTTGRVDYPTIASSGYDAHISWTDSVTGSVKVASSRDRGVTWKTVSVGSTTAGTTSNKTGNPSVAVAGSTVVVTWISSNSGTVKARVSTNRGVTWGTTQTLASTSWGYTAAAVRGSRVAVTWTGEQGVVLAMRTSGTWGAPVVVAPDDGVHTQYAPAIALQDTNRVGIAWAEDTDTADWSVLRWSESPNGGAAFFQPQTLGSTTASGARRANDWPSIVWPTASTRYVAWNGWTPNTNYYRLYLRKGTGTPAAIATAAAPFVDGGADRAPASTGGRGSDTGRNTRR